MLGLMQYIDEFSRIVSMRLTDGIYLLGDIARKFCIWHIFYIDRLK